MPIPATAMCSAAAPPRPRRAARRERAPASARRRRAYRSSRKLSGSAYGAAYLATTKPEAQMRTNRNGVARTASVCGSRLPGRADEGTVSAREIECPPRCTAAPRRGRSRASRPPGRPNRSVAAVSRADLDKDPHDVAAMFDGVARRYDLTNTVLTAGQDRRWRRAAPARRSTCAPASGCSTSPPGTAVSTVELARSGAWCVAADFSLGMLRAGRAPRGAEGRRGRAAPAVRATARSTR